MPLRLEHSSKIRVERDNEDFHTRAHTQVALTCVKKLP